MYWELLGLGLEKFSEIKAFPELSFPTVICSLSLSGIFAWLCSGLTVTKRSFGSIFRSLLPCLKNSQLLQLQLSQWSCIVQLHSEFLGPQGLQTRLEKFWFRDIGSPINPHHSAKMSSAVNCLHSWSLWCKTRSTKSAVVIAAAYLGLYTSSLQGLVVVDIPCKDLGWRRRLWKLFQAFAIKARLQRFDWTLKWQLSKRRGRKCKKGRLLLQVPVHLPLPPSSLSISPVSLTSLLPCYAGLSF